MKQLSIFLLTSVIFTGSAFADVVPDPRNEHGIPYPPERTSSSYGTIVAGAALAAALGIGGAMAIRHLRDQQDKPKTSDGAPVPAAVENK